MKTLETLGIKIGGFLGLEKKCDSKKGRKWVIVSIEVYFKEGLIK